MTKLTFIHAADLHLDSPFAGMSNIPDSIFKRLKESTFQSAKNMFDHAIARAVDFVLLSGDLFDESNRSLKAQLFLRNQFLRLQTHGIEVFIIYGNHDHLGGEWTPIEWPKNVHVFSSSTPSEQSYYRENQLVASIYGFSYKERAVYENMTSHYEKTTNAAYHIGMLHGTLAGQEGHDAYAPFQLQQLLSRDFNYWALGHIHKRAFLHEDPLIIYPGNVQGRHIKETGEKGCYFVHLSENSETAEFISCADVIFETLAIDITETSHMTDLVTLVESKIGELKEEGIPHFVKIELTGDAPPYFERTQLEVLEELMTVLHEQEEEEDVFVWVMSIDCRTNENVIYPQDSFLKELTAEIAQFEAYEELLSPIKRHPVYRKSGKSLTKEDELDIKEEAQRLLTEQLKQ
ncbi:metallophosphoesterase [Bacillus australimaris]|uniref:DNA repair exonuclease n=1 Tax=Bacillus australimaris TaxID=1326968 RepID=A0ABD4QLU5_9BACI|nr:DNA repair exonuclease [Bacillus australimaris]KPN13133.1 metallophosphoesterase [Bacillus australimaris]MBR8691071.1 DNA repair exonuclease [Bacillus australimaris]